MTRLINIEDASLLKTVMDGGLSAKALWKRINRQPTIDAVPVIRCKDCKHYYALNEVRGNCSEYNFIEKISLDYCSWAERKEE